MIIVVHAEDHPVLVSIGNEPPITLAPHTSDSFRSPSHSRSEVVISEAKPSEEPREIPFDRIGL